MACRRVRYFSECKPIMLSSESIGQSQLNIAPRLRRRREQCILFNEWISRQAAWYQHAAQFAG